MNQTILRSNVFESRRISLMAVAAFASMMLMGCATELKVVRATSGGEVPHAGAPYNLTFTQFRILVQTRLLKCLPSSTDSIQDLRIGQKFITSASEIRDPDREYVIDLSSLRALLKTTDIKVEYHENGALKSVNANADDKTGEFVTDLAAVAGKVLVSGFDVSAVAALPKKISPNREGPSPQKEKDPRQVRCSEAVRAALKIQPSLQKEVADKAKRLDEARSELELLTGIAKVLGRAWTDDGRKKLAQAIERSYRASVELSEAKAKLETILDLLTVSRDFMWPLDGRTFEESMAPLDFGALAKWFEDPGELDSQLKKSQISCTGLKLNLRSLAGLPRSAACSGKECKDDATQGLKFRMPVPGELEITSNNEQCGIGQSRISVSHRAMVSQLSPVFSLPLRNYPFMNQNVAALFDEAGRPMTIGYQSDAVAGRASGAISSIVDQAIKVREARRPKSELERLKEETELLQARAALEAARQSLAVPKSKEQSVAAQEFQADAAFAAAEAAGLRASAALAAAQAESSRR